MIVKSILQWRERQSESFGERILQALKGPCGSSTPHSACVFHTRSNCSFVDSFHAQRGNVTIKTPQDSQHPRARAAPPWDSCSKHDAMSLERVQLSVARAILPTSRRSCHNTDVLRKIGWPTLAWRRRRQKLLLLWDLLQGSGPPNLRNQVSPASTRTQYCLRNPLSLAAPHCRTVHRLKSFLPSTVTLFNSLPSSAVSCTSKSSFKHAIDLHFVEDKFSFGLL